LSLLGVASPSLLIYGRVRLDHIEGHARAPTKPCELGVYDSYKVGYLSCAQRSCIPYTDGGIRCGMHAILQARIRYALTLISPLAAIVLWSGAASLDPLEDLAYDGLRDPVQGLYGG
jgi:hypothetical protein